MRLLIPAASLAILANCAIEPQTPETSEATSELNATNTSAQWDSQKNDIDDIWPTGQTIKNAYVLIKKGENFPNGNAATFYGIVVWNSDTTPTVGKIWRVSVGQDGQHFRDIVDSAIATRTFGHFDRDGGSTGNGNGDAPIPRPHPSGLPCCALFSTGELDNARMNAVIIQNAAHSAVHYSE